MARTMKLRRGRRRSRRHSFRRRQRGGSLSKEFHFSNEYHFGDSIYNLKFFMGILPILSRRNIFIHVYVNPDKINELKRYSDSKYIQLHPINEKPSGTIQLWQGNSVNGTTRYDTEIYYKKTYEFIAKTIGIQNETINTSLYQDEDYLLDVYNKLDDKFKNVDVLIINGEPITERAAFSKEKFNSLAKRLSKRCKVVTTHCVDSSIACTLKDGLQIQDIGAISTHAKYIVSMHTGPIVACLNKHTKQHVRKWFIVATERFNYTELPHEFFLSSDALDTIDSKIVI